ncbi:MAG TPA: serine/threonine-protein kinase [Casimicrobiaceae bacterium]|nr:serine/threonine-protein kinase [Casimicrobiaceae bacterium]
MTHPTRIGKYEIDSVLGKGAMGVVYKAIDPHIERSVAIKTVRKDLLDAELVEQLMARFRNEARAAGRLHHPNIIAIYEYGEDESVAYIAMEYVEGMGLREYLNRNARFELHQIAAMMAQLLKALEFAHAQGVVHRDIKPANLILTKTGVLKVADFGIARIDATTLTMTGMVMGTPSYMAPEQCRGLQSDHRADLFSTGVVFYELLTGTRPFAGSMESVAYKICHEHPRPASGLCPFAIPASIDALLDKALAKEPADRFADARAFALALRLACGEPTGGPTGETTVINLSELPLKPPTVQPTWDDASLATVERQLVRFVGPLARILVRQAALSAHDASELYALLAVHIDDPEERERFVALARTSEASGSHGKRAGTEGRPTTGSRGAPTSSRTHTRTPRPLEPAFVEHTTSRLAIYLGPIAKVVAKKAAQQAHDADEFVQLVAEHIGTQEREQFLREVGDA